MILAGDVGGTKVHLALYSFDSGKLRPVRDQKYPAAEHATLDEVVIKFLAEDPSDSVRDPASIARDPASIARDPASIARDPASIARDPASIARDPASIAADHGIVAACFGCPGPVRDGRIKLTNLPWTLDVRDLAVSLKIAHIFLINDLEANGYGIPELASDSIFTLHKADASAVGHRGLISAGTGLGEALLIWDTHLRRHTPIPSEGGHCDFAPRNDREIALLQYLRQTLDGRVSFERVVSGIGIKNIYAFLRDAEKMEEPAWLRDRLATEDPNAVIGCCAEDGSSPICYDTMQIFSAAFGAEAGNIALKVLSTGGIYLGGGIAPKILQTLQAGSFTEAFLDKGRLRPLLEAMPVRVILNDTCALLGAAAYAESRASEVSGHSERAASIQG